MTEGARSSPPPHGTLAEEAVRLAEVAQEWLGGRSRQPRADVWAAATSVSSPSDAPAECRTCPICRARRAAAGVDPVVFEHLADAAVSLAAAARAVGRPDDPAGRR